MADDKLKRALEILGQAHSNGLPDEIKQNQKTSKELADYYRKYLKDVKAHLKVWLERYDELSFAEKLQVEHLLNVNNTINQLIGEPMDSVEQSIKKRILTAGDDAYNGVWYQLEQGYNLTLHFSMLDEKFFEKLMEQPVAGRRLSKRLYNHRIQLARRTQEAIARGFLLGKSYAEIARDVANETEANYKQAVRIVRTESGRVSSLSTLKGYDEATNQGIELIKQWMSTFDSRTRHNHGVLDGQRADKDDYFKVSGHKAKAPRLFGVAAEDINCRCTTVAIVDDIVPELRNPDGTLSKWQNYDEWLKRKQKELKNGIIDGSKRQARFAADDYENAKSNLSRNELIKLNKEAGKITSEEYDRINNGSLGYIGTTNSWDINEDLRNNRKVSEENAKTVEMLDAVIAKNKLPFALQTTRFVDDDFITRNLSNNEKVVRDLGYISISANESENVFTGRNVRLNIVVPKGANVYVTDNFKESELILPRGSKFEVVTTPKKTIDRWGDIVYEVTLKIIE
ncbi:hypothetical protein COC69_05795 [Bacillus cereus]|uniref:NAD(+)--protein-arginine ADP-ribosyltransferase n=1 Tax=Bacillus cereus TaxID=1396 RepID=A0A9X7GXA0_BACCE|nr:phage minor head protein [Bacillus cereus]PGS81642.1 hypothetical protein COC69_05795 [Bacillus cereus]